MIFYLKSVFLPEGVFFTWKLEIAVTPLKVFFLPGRCFFYLGGVFPDLTGIAVTPGKMFFLLGQVFFYLARCFLPGNSAKPSPKCFFLPDKFFSQLKRLFFT